jgi:membrane-bound serine protease (ClpP class)
MNSALRRGIVLLCFAALLVGQDAAPINPPAQPAAGASSILPGADVAVIRIEGMIYDFTLDSLKRRVERAVAGGASAIVIELDTNGGLVESALKIAKYIKGDISVPTIAWVNNKAYSAGILIASSCDELVMSPASTTGDCAPIVPGSELAPTERAKQLSPILEEFRDNARRNGYDYAMFHAMCVLGVELYMVEHKDTGEQRIVNQADYAVMVEGTDPAQAATSPGAATQAAGAQTLPDIYGVAPDVAESDRGMWTKVRLLHDGKTLLTVNQDRAFDMRLAKSKSIRNTADLKVHLAANTVTPIAQTWSENVAGWLTSLPVRAVLILALMLGAYVELQTPGLGFPGAIALVALVLLFGAPYLIGLAEIWHVILFFAGVALLLVELLVLPGFGIFGIAGLVCMFTGLVLAVVPTSGGGPISLPPSEMVGRLQLSLIWTMLGIVAAFIGFYYIAKHFQSIPLLNRMILQSPDVVPAPATAGGGEAVGFGQVRVGDTGRAITGLRPTGRIDIDGQPIDVVTPGNWIDVGDTVKVIEVAGNRIVVDQVNGA